MGSGCHWDSAEGEGDASDINKCNVTIRFYQQYCSCDGGRFAVFYFLQCRFHDTNGCIVLGIAALSLPSRLPFLLFILLLTGSCVRAVSQFVKSGGSKILFGQLVAKHPTDVPHSGPPSLPLLRATKMHATQKLCCLLRGQKCSTPAAQKERSTFYDLFANTTILCQNFSFILSNLCEYR